MGIILASRSPRRQELLKGLIEDFRAIPSTIDERCIEEKDPVKFAVSAAVLKARDIGNKYPSDIVIGADTVVSIDREIIGKPKDYADAKGMLEKLSGTKHRVITGLALYKKDEERLLTGYEITRVQFKNLAQQDIEEYLAKNEYMDKAGAYAIQAVGDRFVESLIGSYDNVVGLPVNRVKQLLARFSCPEVEVEVVDIAFPKEWAVGRDKGKVVFITSGAVYGDRIRVKLSKQKKSFSYGEIVEVVTPSPYRTNPECPHFGNCGGCVFQNLKYTKQIELKERYFLTTLKKIGGINAERSELHHIIPSPDIFYYRNKMEFAFGTDEGKVSLGLRARYSPFEMNRRTCVALNECMIFSPSVKKVFPTFLRFAQKTGLSSYDPHSDRGFFRHLVLREGKNTGELMAVLVTKSGEIPDMTGLAEELSGVVQSLWWVENNRLSDVVSFEKKHRLYGSQSIEERMDNLRFRIYPQSFFQPNTRAALLMYGKIKETIEEQAEHKKILGLYCGTGSIEISLADSAVEIIGIDSEESNIINAKENCRLNGITNCNFYQGYVEEIIRKNSSVVERTDVVIVDPPRAGLSSRALKNILKVSAPTIIYVSCNPAAFARDSAELVSAGYKPKRLYCFDFFPHTTHMEVMGVFLKK